MSEETTMRVQEAGGNHSLPAARETGAAAVWHATVDFRVERGCAPAAGRDAELLERGMGGDERAMRGLVARVLPSVRVRVRLSLLRWRGQAQGRDLRAEVEDLSQEVFAALFEDRGRVLRSWQPERGLSLTGFVGLVAERMVGGILRSGRRSPFTEEATAEEALRQIEGASPGPQSTTTDLIEARNLLEAVLDRLENRLSAQGLRLFELLHVDELSVEEVCGITGMTADAVYAWRTRIGKLAREVRAELTDQQPRGGGEICRVVVRAGAPPAKRTQRQINEEIGAEAIAARFPPGSQTRTTKGKGR
jgi:RNA polymerase sigma-70 factor (ECF subfamily)